MARSSTRASASLTVLVFSTHMKFLRKYGTLCLATGLCGGIFRAWSNWQSLFIIRALGTMWVLGRCWSEPCVISAAPSARFPASISNGCAQTWRRGGAIWRISRPTSILGKMRQEMLPATCEISTLKDRRLCPRLRCDASATPRCLSCLGCLDQIKVVGPRLLKSCCCEVPTRIFGEIAIAAKGAIARRAGVRSSS